MVDDVTIADSARASIMSETNLQPVYYSSRRRQGGCACALRAPHPLREEGGRALLLDRPGDRLIENAAWAYPEPIAGSPGFGGLIAFYWDRVDRWFEDDEETFVHPRDPHHRSTSCPARGACGSRSTASCLPRAAPRSRCSSRTCRPAGAWRARMSTRTSSRSTPSRAAAAGASPGTTRCSWPAAGSSRTRLVLHPAVRRGAAARRSPLLAQRAGRYRGGWRTPGTSGDGLESRNPL